MFTSHSIFSRSLEKSPHQSPRSAFQRFQDEDYHLDHNANGDDESFNCDDDDDDDVDDDDDDDVFL